MATNQFTLNVISTLKISSVWARAFAYAILDECIPLKYTNKLGMTREAFDLWTDFTTALQDDQFPPSIPYELLGLFFGPLYMDNVGSLQGLTYLLRGETTVIDLAPKDKLHYRKVLQMDSLTTWARNFLDSQEEEDRKAVEHARKDEVQHLRNTAKRLGFTLTPVPNKNED